MKLFKITNPLWVANLAPHIQKMIAKLALPNIDYYALVTHYQHIAQVGGNKAEIFVVTEGDDAIPIAFANWVLKGTPFVGTAYLEFIYSQKVGAAEMLLGEFKQFAERNNSPYIMCDIGNNGKLIKHFRKLAKNYNVNIQEAPTVTFLARI
jgi:hypothetical protein